MFRLSNRLIVTAALAAIVLWTAPSLGEVTLRPPQVQVTEGDRTVKLTWNDPNPEDLVSVEEPVLGSLQFPWDGHADLETRGFYTGACDWTYDILVSRFAGTKTMELNWQQVTDWMTMRIEAQRITVTELDHFYQLSDGIEMTVKSDGLFDPDLGGWTGPSPGLGGLMTDVYIDLATPDYTQPIEFTFACTSGGDLTSTSGGIGFSWEARIAWHDAALQPDSTLLAAGSLVIGQADSPGAVYRGLTMMFPAGTFVEGEIFSVGVLLPLVVGDRISIEANTFEGYLALRRSVEDRPATGAGDGEGLYKVISRISKCDSFELFFDEDLGVPDPYGTREYTDEGILTSQPGVDQAPDFKTVLNGFPYDYAVVTFDWSDTYQQMLSEIVWQRVFPSVPPAGSASGVQVVPNPYVGRAGWETGGRAKIQFVNIPGGAKIRIYDAAGGYINTVHPNTYSYDPDEPQGTADWNLKDSDGKDVVSGIYVYRIESNAGNDTGRFIVVR